MLLEIEETVQYDQICLDFCTKSLNSLQNCRLSAIESANQYTVGVFSAVKNGAHNQRFTSV